jgi:hypothetical protein
VIFSQVFVSRGTPGNSNRTLNFGASCDLLSLLSLRATWLQREQGNAAAAASGRRRRTLAPGRWPASSRAYCWSGRLADAAARAVEVGLRRTKCWGSSTSAGASCTRWPPSSHRPSRYLLICSHSDQLYVCSSCCGHSVLMVTTNGIGRMLIALQSHRFEQGSCIEACDHLWNNLMYF